jgi:uncharacterized protein with ParB-like and HNH nuclease domain
MNESKKDDNLEVDGDFDQEVETEVYFNYEIAAYPSDYTLSVLDNMWNEDDIVIPDYQRNYVWTIKQASLLIESFLLGLPVPQVFFYVNDDNKYEVIDGQQRITSVVYFLSGLFGDENIHGKKQVFRLTGLSEASPFHKKLFSELDEIYQRKLKGSVLRVINIKQLNPKGESTSAYHIFERLNTGGSPLKPQEIRNVVFRGGIIDKLKEINSLKEWRDILGKNNLDKHQKDIELILRLFGLSTRFSKYEKPMKEFLNKTMSENRQGTTASFNKFYSEFPKICKLIISKMGNKPFHIRGPLNLPALDSVFVTIYNNKNICENLNASFSKLLNDSDYDSTTKISTSDLSVIKTRLGKAKEYLVG